METHIFVKTVGLSTVVIEKSTASCFRLYTDTWGDIIIHKTFVLSGDFPI